MATTHRTTGAKGAAADQRDHYALLDIPYSATAAEITRAYRKAMKRVHPDGKQPSERPEAEDRARRLNLAYSTLIHAEARRTYDQTLKARVIQDQIMSQYFSGFGMPGSADPSGAHLKRNPSANDLASQKQGDRHAMLSIVIVFAGVTAAILLLLALWAAIGALLSAAT